MINVNRKLMRCKVKQTLNVVYSVKCKKCFLMKNRKRTTDYADAHVHYRYEDEIRSPWNGLECPDCRKLRVVANARKKGIGTIDEVKNVWRQKGRKAERIVEKYFLDKGYHVVLTTNKGPDLIIEKDGIKKTVEVKAIGFCSRSVKNSVRVSKVKDNRKNDDFIAYVRVDDEKIVIRPMMDHLLDCRSGGCVTVTNYFKGV